MDIVVLVKAALMGIVEGLTEFLPISSTGHLILAGSLLGFDDEKSKVFDIAIQTGAIFAVVIVYWQRVRETLAGLASDRKAQRFALNVAIAFVPAVILALPVDDDDGEDRAGLNRDVEDLALLVVEAEQRTGEDEVTGARDRQELGQPFDDAHEGGLDQHDDVQTVFLAKRRGMIAALSSTSVRGAASGPAVEDAGSMA